MDISSTGSIQPGSVGDQHRIDQVEPTRKKIKGDVYVQSRGDSVSLSERAQLFARLAEAIHRTPDVRQDRVDALRTAVERGSYEVSDSEIAAAILKVGGK